MRNIRLTIEYDGSRYQGWSRLGKNESTNTISNKILDVIKKMSGEDVELFCGHAYRSRRPRLRITSEFQDFIPNGSYRDAAVSEPLSSDGHRHY